MKEPENISEKIFEELKFNVNGVTFQNEEGKDIQKEIRKIFLEYEKNGCFEKYSGYTNSEIKEFVTEVAEFEDAEVEMKLKEDTYEDKPCVKIYIKRYDNSYCHIGYVPKGTVKKYLKLKEHFKKMKPNINLIGGRIKQLGYDDITDKEIVETVELNYGFEVVLTFYNEEDELKKEVEKKKQEAIKQLEIMKNEEIEKNKINNEDFSSIEAKNNIILFIITAIISIPFVWILWKILSFVFWIFE